MNQLIIKDDEDYNIGYGNEDLHLDGNQEEELRPNVLDYSNYNTHNQSVEEVDFSKGRMSLKMVDQ